MSKNNYYYKKLAQAIIFSDSNWESIVDFNDPCDNIFCVEFLDALWNVLMEYEKKKCLEEAEKNNVAILLSDLRDLYPYETRTEKECIWEYINQLITLNNLICHDKDGVLLFCLEEYKKRYGSSQKCEFTNGCMLVLRQLVSHDVKTMKEDIAYDIYPLTLLYHTIEELTPEHVENFLMSEFFISTLNALRVEYPSVLEDAEIRNRFLYILRKNREKFQTKNYGPLDQHDLFFQMGNHQLLKQLERKNNSKNK